MPESEQQTIATNIPFLFYDVIGRMFPGGFLIIGGFLSSLHFLPYYWFDSWLKPTKVSEPSVGFAALVIGLAVLLFGAVSSFLGFVLAALSNVTVEKPWRLWSPYNLEGLSKFLGIDDLGVLNSQFKAQFGSGPKNESLNESSF